MDSMDKKTGTMAIILGISLLAVSFPSLSQKTRLVSIPKIVFFIGKHFGTGVILSTAFVHLLADAFEALANPAVKSKYSWVSDRIGLIILGSLLLIFLVEYISTSLVDHLHQHEEHEEADEEATIASSEEASPDEHTALLSSSRHSHDSRRSSEAPKSRHAHYLDSIVTNSPRHYRSTEYFYIINDVNRQISNGEYRVVGGSKKGNCVCVCMCPAGQEGSSKQISVVHQDIPGHHHPHHHPHEEQEEHKDEIPHLSRKRQIVGILVLQLGIMIHSLVIGLTLAITSGAEFTTLTTAIIFHQLFEGLSLGIRIAAIPPPPTPSFTGRWLQPVLSILFAITTPVGICMGLLLFSNGEEVKMLLTQGLMSAISAGMLIYAGTVEMLAGDFVFTPGSGHGHSHGGEFTGDDDELTWRKKTIALVSLCAGVVGMSLVGLGE